MADPASCWAGDDHFRRNLAIGAGIDEGSQSTRKPSRQKLRETSGKFACPLPIKGLRLP